MIKKLTLTLIALSLVACDAPRDRRSAWSGSSDTGYSSTSGSTQQSDVADRTPSSGTDSGSNVSVPEEISHCKWSADGNTGFDDYDNAHLGPNTICQSTVNKNDFYIQVRTPIIDSMVCFIPTITNTSSGTTQRVGNPRCLWLKDNTKIYPISLYTNRSGFTGKESLINGVMVMKDKTYFFNSPYYQYMLAPDAYIECTNHWDINKYSGYCDEFKRVNQYKFKKFY